VLVQPPGDTSPGGYLVRRGGGFQPPCHPIILRKYVIKIHQGKADGIRRDDSRKPAIQTKENPLKISGLK